MEKNYLEYEGHIYELDSEGYLKNIREWDEEFATQMALLENITLTPAHWEIIYFLRDYYERYRISPMIRILSKVISKRLGTEKGDNKYLYNLFPRGPSLQGCRIAGLPSPVGCS